MFSEGCSFECQVHDAQYSSIYNGCGSVKFVPEQGRTGGTYRIRVLGLSVVTHVHGENLKEQRL